MSDVQTSEPDLVQLKAELDSIQIQQAKGGWERQPGEAQSAWEDRVAAIVRRGIEITALLRRANTGPAKPKSRTKRVVDMEAITRELLD
jgi:hypothetical protein